MVYQIRRKCDVSKAGIFGVSEEGNIWCIKAVECFIASKEGGGVKVGKVSSARLSQYFRLSVRKLHPNSAIM